MKRGPKPMSTEQLERLKASMSKALGEHHGIVNRAARQLGMNLRTFYRWMEKLEINPDIYRPAGYEQRRES